MTQGSQKDQSAQSEALSVSAAMALAKGALEGVTVRLMGEVSEVSVKRGYKAAYFTVKDKNASLPCMMWNNRYEKTGVQLAVGQLVEIAGRFTLYAPAGRMNFDVFSLSLAGEGKLRAQVAELARKLEAEGLMRTERKRALPVLPQRIGLVTSPRGAAVHDVLRTLRRRYPLAEVLLAGVAVEGPTAPAGVAEGMRCVVRAGAEVVLVVRGGGAYEVLMPFNDEGLARTIAACPVPVITGIGHEPDTTIADMVADVRASTPTAAAEKVSQSVEELQQGLVAQSRTLRMYVTRQIEREGAHVKALAARPVFRDATQLFAVEAQTLDMASERLSRALPASIERDKQRLEALSARLTLALPRAVERDRSQVSAAASRLALALPRALERDRTRVDAAASRLSRCLSLATHTQSAQLENMRERLRVRGQHALEPFQAQMHMTAARLHDLSPLVILGRGYAIARTEDGAIVKQVAQAPPGSQVSISVADGEMDCRVESTRRVDTVVEDLGV